MVKVLKRAEEHAAALEELDRLMMLDPEPESAEGERLELLALLVEEYERSHHPIELPDPVDAILFRMEQAGLTQRDLAAYIGSPSKVSEVLARKRPLSLAMIRRLHRGLGISLEVLIQESEVGRRSRRGVAEPV